MPRLFGESTAHFQTYVRAWCAMTLDACRAGRSGRRRSSRCSTAPSPSSAVSSSSTCALRTTPTARRCCSPTSVAQDANREEVTHREVQSGRGASDDQRSASGGEGGGFAAVPPKARATAAAAPATGRAGVAGARPGWRLRRPRGEARCSRGKGIGMMGGMLAAAAGLSGGVMLPAFMSALVTAAFRRAPSWTPGAPPQPRRRR